MTARALLVGCQTYGLTGVHNDVRLIGERLTTLGFTVSSLIDQDATRHGILDAYEKLIKATPAASTDPVVFYYSGHGSRRTVRGGSGVTVDEIRYIVPTDTEDSTPSDFRGILAEELSYYQRRLTERTANVTTILDCCFAGTMSRRAADNEAEPLVKSSPRTIPVDAVPGLRTIVRRRRTAAELDDSNTRAVRVVACNALQSAYERVGALDVRHGLLTETLAEVLADPNCARLSWAVVAERLRYSAGAAQLDQYPDVEGPADRLLFGVETRRARTALPLSIDGGTPVIESADLFSIDIGDTFAVLDEAEEKLGTATVLSVTGQSAALGLTPAGIVSEIGVGALAVPLTKQRSHPVRLEVPAAPRAVLTALIDQAPDLVLSDASPASVVCDDEGLVVLDSAGARLNLAPFAGPGSEQAAVAALELIARAERLRQFASTPPTAPLPGTIEVELATLTGDSGARVRTVRQNSGEKLYLGERVSLTIRNRSGVQVHVAMLDIDTASRIVMHNVSQPSGWVLEPGAEKVVHPDGAGLVWDTGFPPATGERAETFVIIAADHPQRFRLLATPESSRSAEPLSELERLLREEATGSRGLPVEEEDLAEPVRYSVHRVDFSLVPSVVPDLSEPDFAINERPNDDRRGVVPRGTSVPEQVAIRLVSLRVNQNKALIRATVRVDVLVITTTPDGIIVAHPFTERFPGIADSDLLPFERLAVFNGPVRDAVDIRIWVSRDDRKGADLSALFAQAASDPNNQTALTTVGTLMFAAPQVALAVGAMAAVATLVRVAADLISTGVGQHIALYRNGFLPFEQFGVGRHPSYGTQNSQGISFAYEVIDVT